MGNILTIVFNNNTNKNTNNNTNKIYLFLV